MAQHRSWRSRLGKRPWRASAAVPTTLALIALAVLAPTTARADANRHNCLRWRGSGGLEHTLVANRIGEANLLTKNQKLDPGVPDGSRPIYRDSDIARLCRSY